MSELLKRRYGTDGIEAGCDEAGRGCLAGPVVAAAVILPEDFNYPELNDSKKLSPKIRAQLAEVIKSEALSYGIGIIDHHGIDRYNILNASFRAMHAAIDKLALQAGLLLIDGNRFIPYKKTLHQCIIKGDSLYQSIAAASILAKTFRDQFMLELHNEYPVYNWTQNKGYPTNQHREAIVKYGISPFHRRSFRLYPAGKQLKMFI